MSNYKLLGGWSFWHKPQDKKFVDGGYWMLGWEEKDQSKQYALAKKMKPGDRIAIKRRKGQGQKEIKIFHIGIIRGVVLETSNVICIVDWVATDLQRDVAVKGCLGSIHGPFKKNDWVEQIFCL